MSNVSLLPKVVLCVSPLRQVYQDFVLSRQAMRCTPATLEHYRYSAGKFIEYMEGENVTDPRDIKPVHVYAWLASMPNAASATLHAKARGIRAMFHFWFDEKYIDQPIKFKMPRLEKKRLPYLSENEFREVLAGANKRDKAILLVMVDAGLRRAEVCNLNFQDVDFTSGACAVHQGKGRKDRAVFIGANTRRAILAYRKDIPSMDGPMFFTQGRTRLTVRGMSMIFKRLSKKVFLKITPHMIRRTFAVLFLKQGGDLPTLRALMGHADIATTDQYISLLTSDLAEQHAKHGADSWL